MNVWLRLSATFHEHPKMLAVRKSAGSRADSAELGWYRVLMAAKRYGRWTFASESHLEHVAGAFYRFVPLYRSERLLDDLTVHDGDSYNAIKTDAERKAEQRERDHLSRAGVTSNRDVARDQNVTLQTEREERDNREDRDARAPDEDRWEAPEQPVLVWLSRHGCDVRPGNGYHQKLITAVEVHGSEKMLSMLDRLAGAGIANGDTKGYLFGAIDALNAKTRPSLKALEQEEAAERNEVSVRRRVENTHRRLHELGSHQDEPRAGCPLCQPVTA